jgi:hypothetical protein
MFKVKNLGTIALSVFAITFLYQVFTKSFTDQGGEFKKYAEESEADVRELEASFAKSRAATQSLSTDSSEDSLADSSTLEAKPSRSDSFRFPKASCGDKPTGGDDTWYPVFVDGGDLESIRTNYCADAIATTRKDTGAKTVQLASLTSRDKANKLAQAVGGSIGEPTYPDAASSSTLPDPTEDSSPSSVTSNPPASLALNVFRWKANEYGYVDVEGQLTNTSDRSIRSLQGLIEFYDADGQFITSQFVPITITPLMPGQTSPFKSVAKYNPQMHLAKMRFKTYEGEISYSQP